MGTKSKKKAKTRLDAYYRLAKDQGFRARSAFKLIQLNRIYGFLGKSHVLVDLCAAPGGWCQVAAKNMPIGSKIIGVDLVPIAPIRGVMTFVGDITDDKTRKTIVAMLKKAPVDCVIHDGAPNVGGVWSRDLFQQNALVLAAAKTASTLLRPGGWFVTKVFRSQDSDKLLWVLKVLFDKVEATKPHASRMESAETFVVCEGFKAPKQLDSALFNAQKVFADVGMEKIMTPSGALVIPKTNVPQGYDEFATVTHRVASFVDFLHCKDPKEFLKKFHEIRFSTDEDKAFLKSKHSKKELVFLCGDLLQVGDADLRRLVRWREQILRDQERLKKAEDAEEYGDEPGASDEDGEVEGEDTATVGDLETAEGITKIAHELLELRKKRLKEMKKKQKKVVDRKLKQVKGLINFDPTISAEHLTETDGFGSSALGLDAAPARGGGDGDDGDDTNSLEEGEWSISRIAEIDEAHLGRFMDKNYEEPDTHLSHPLNPVVSADLAGEEDYDLGIGGDGESYASEGGSDDEDGIRKPLRLIEGDDLQEYDVDNYGNYIQAQRSARVKLFEEGIVPPEEEDEEDDGGEGEEGALTDAERKKLARAEQDKADLDAAGKQSKWQRHHLNVNKVLNKTFPMPKEPKSGPDKRKRAIEEDLIHMSAPTALAGDAMLASRGAKGAKRMRFDPSVESDDDDEDDDDDDDDSSWDNLSQDRYEDDRSDLNVNVGRVDSRRKKAIVPDIGVLTTQETVRMQRKQALKDNKELRKQNKKQRNNKKKDDEMLFEEVPIALTDPESRARTLAIATKMLDKRSRRDILDASINRYTFNDDDDLPDWFIKDEQRNCKVFLPVTAEEIEAQRLRFKELSSRPSRKVMEAMGRKRRKAQRMLRGMLEKGKSDPRARQKANNMSVRKLMRSQAVKGNYAKKKNAPLDRKSMGERKRAKQAAKRRK